ncbi:hypothetical protein CMUS01_05431 [Colletotrichum musicola]|uniref:Uncharacterized protein n=1 Tax=Colletotrichum musicola TaxID=2175873 RepID=A0A8H6KRG7_9PEZI|nr:hypothetical protein CMUS01_05431 [Colletotrichum musicola]
MIRFCLDPSHIQDGLQSHPWLAGGIRTATETVPGCVRRLPWVQDAAGAGQCRRLAIDGARRSGWPHAFVLDQMTCHLAQCTTSQFHTVNTNAVFRKQSCIPWPPIFVLRILNKQDRPKPSVCTASSPIEIRISHLVLGAKLPISKSGMAVAGDSEMNKTGGDADDEHAGAASVEAETDGRGCVAVTVELAGAVDAR